jgi:hypothetical protein
MKKMNLEFFSYKSVKGKHSDRAAFIISEPSDSYFAIDLSEFPEDEQSYYAGILKDIYETNQKELKEALRTLGLAGNYRRFKEEGVNNE